jgi:hypothetical protein
MRKVDIRCNNYFAQVLGTNMSAEPAALSFRGKNRQVDTAQPFRARDNVNLNNPPVGERRLEGAEEAPERVGG